MKSAQGRADALAYWVVSHHFEELGRAPRLLHGGFGLLTVGNLRNPRKKMTPTPAGAELFFLSRETRNGGVQFPLEHVVHSGESVQEASRVDSQSDSLTHGYERLQTDTDEQARFAGQGLGRLDTGVHTVPLCKAGHIGYTLDVFHLMALFYSQ